MSERREWPEGWLREQARIARESYEARPAWVKRISHFAGTNNVCTQCALVKCACDSKGRP